MELTFLMVTYPYKINISNGYLNNVNCTVHICRYTYISIENVKKICEVVECLSRTFHFIIEKLHENMNRCTIRISYDT